MRTRNDPRGTNHELLRRELRAYYNGPHEVEVANSSEVGRRVARRCEIVAPRVSTADSQLVLGHPQALYGHAVLHLLVMVGDEKWTLLFAFVELLPCEVPPPLHDGVIEGPRLKKTNRRIYADHVPLPVPRAMAWY